LGVPDMAVADFSKAMDVAGPNAELLAERAIALTEMGKRSLTNKNYKRAVYDLTWVLDEMADQLVSPAPILFHRAQAQALIAARNWFDKSAYQLALDDYSEALTNKPDFLEALFCRASLHWQLGRVAETLEDCNKLIDMKSDHTDALQLRAETYLKMKEPEKAEADFQTIDRIHDILAQQQAQNLEENRSACDTLDCSRFCRH
jgi:tetratricopeptide (TPR) repeat protein